MTHDKNPSMSNGHWQWTYQLHNQVETETRVHFLADSAATVDGESQMHGSSAVDGMSQVEGSSAVA